MKKIIISLFSLIILMESCTITPKDKSILAVKNKVIELNKASDLKGEKLNLEVMGLVSGNLTDSLFLLRSLDSINSLKVYNCKTLEFYGELFKTGQGPGEYLNMSTEGQYENTPNGIKLWVYDTLIKKMRLINISKSLQKKAIIQEREYDIDASLQNPYYINDTCLLSTFYTGNNMSLCVFNPANKKRTDFFNFYNQYSEGDFTTYIAGNAKLKPDKSKFAYAFIHLNQVLISSANGKDKFSISIGAPISKDILDKTAIKNRVKYFSSIAVTDDQIWLSYNGLPKNILNSSENKEPCKIIVLDWNGNLLYYFKLKNRLAKIFIDSKKDVLYGIDKEENIIRYDIKKFH